MNLTKPKRYQSEDYLTYIKSKPCLVCQQAGVHAHHVRFHGEGGIGTKVSDLQAVPLCPIHHRDYHDIGKTRFESLCGLDMEKVVRQLNHEFIERLLEAV